MFRSPGPSSGEFTNVIRSYKFIRRPSYPTDLLFQSFTIRWIQVCGNNTIIKDRVAFADIYMYLYFVRNRMQNTRIKQRSNNSVFDWVLNFVSLLRIMNHEYDSRRYKYSVANDVTTITVMINLRLFMINSWITVHLGRNPINGGKPPSDISVVNSKNFVAVLWFAVIVWLTNETLNNLAIVTTGDVNIE
jgi:hypothetical protein